MTRVLVIGGGVAGCAAAVAAAEAGARVTLVEAGHHLGGVAAQGEHRTLCGLSPIDAATPDLLEPALTGPWVAALASGAPRRHGRVWLWPTDAQCLQAGLARRLERAGVEVRRGGRVVALPAAEPGTTVATRGNLDRCATLAAGSRFAFDELIDASGGAAIAALVRTGPPAAAPMAVAGTATEENWPAFRALVRAKVPSAIPTGTVPRVRAEARAAAAAGVPSAALVAVADERWQLSLDLPPGSTLVQADAAMQRAAAALMMEILACTRKLATRDDGRADATVSLRELFSTDVRGWCWAAWPAEHHGAEGVFWNWPQRDRHGIPYAAVRARHMPPWLWTVGKGMPVTAAAAAALRVTGTALALGTAVGAVVAAPDPRDALVVHFNAGNGQPEPRVIPPAGDSRPADSPDDDLPADDWP